MIWFTGDTHFGHTNIMRYSGRPFDTSEEMDERLIELWNDRIALDDDVYHVGDFAFGHPRYVASVVRRLNGNKHLVLGNHDKTIRKQKDLERMFVWCKECHEMYVPDEDVKGKFGNEKGRQKIVLMHYAMRVWNKSHYGSFQLHGHSHGTLSQDPKLLQMDVGVDAVGDRGFEPYAPVSYEMVKRYMAKLSWEPIDHHGERSE
jgi:calcineurin-like phosphoesterase family protein